MMISEYSKKNKPNFFDKILIFERKIDDTKLTFLCKTKPIWKLTQMFVTKALTKDYNRKDTWCRGKNKPKTNPMVCYILTNLFFNI